MVTTLGPCLDAWRLTHRLGPPSASMVTTIPSASIVTTTWSLHLDPNKNGWSLLPKMIGSLTQIYLTGQIRRLEALTS